MYGYYAIKKWKVLKNRNEGTFGHWHPFRTSTSMKAITDRLSQFPLELIFWIGSIVAILTIDPSVSNHFTLCPLENLGFDWCPGCGLGRSMNLLARGEFQASWSMHPLAMLAYVVIFSRIWNLIKNLKTTHNYG